MTPLRQVYEVFLSKISDYTFLSLTPSQIEEDLFGYLRSATTRFHRCKKDLSIQSNSLVSTLTLFEIEILVTLMICEYMKPLILSSELMKQSLSDKDFRIYSQANQIRELNLTYRMFRTEAQRLMTDYNYLDLSETDFRD
ncbi:hypothetical protein [Thermoactinomyces sp. DSM 45892]|uniref:hypothetical protein n=1 Tax=Thermoactinomyces sp. DSM 45892 TaxID=1882753 RepID=UPI00089B606F|nr:hypothetical protein [Thermoactinomyces sp. DSM 45892]SDX95502.1 hypothetical protein SAMN05444416_10195 [Thermoactinomyces sp. DSM 45892]